MRKTKLVIAKLQEWITTPKPLSTNYTKEETAARLKSCGRVLAPNAYGVKSAAQTLLQQGAPPALTRGGRLEHGGSVIQPPHAYALSTGGVWFGAGVGLPF